MPSIELTKEVRTEAISSIKRYCEENFREPIGDLAAGLLLDYFLEEIGPAVYNRGVSDAQTRLQGKMADVESELYIQGFDYWRQLDAKRRKKGR